MSDICNHLYDEDGICYVCEKTTHDEIEQLRALESKYRAKIDRWRGENEALIAMVQSLRENYRDLLTEHQELYHAIRSHEQALDDGDRVELPIERYNELLEIEKMTQSFVAVCELNRTGGGPAYEP